MADPGKAFQSLSESPQWLAAFAIILVLGLIGRWLQLPAIHHIELVTLLALPQAQGNPRIAAQVAEASPAAPLSLIVLYGMQVVVSVLFSSLMLLGLSAYLGTQANFKRLWSASMNAAVVSLGLASFVSGIIVLARGPTNFASSRELLIAQLSLASMYGGHDAVLLTTLRCCSVFSGWALMLNFFIAREISRMQSQAAIFASVSIFFAFVAFEVAAVAIPLALLPV